MDLYNIPVSYLDVDMEKIATVKFIGKLSQIMSLTDLKSTTSMWHLRMVKSVI